MYLKRTISWCCSVLLFSNSDRSILVNASSNKHHVEASQHRKSFWFSSMKTSTAMLHRVRHLRDHNEDPPEIDVTSPPATVPTTSYPTNPPLPETTPAPGTKSPSSSPTKAPQTLEPTFEQTEPPTTVLTQAPPQTTQEPPPESTQPPTLSPTPEGSVKLTTKLEEPPESCTGFWGCWFWWIIIVILISVCCCCYYCLVVKPQEGYEEVPNTEDR